MPEFDDIHVAIVAESASERFGGEAILPLHYFKRLRSRGVDAWLVVHERTRQELDEILSDQRDRIRYVADDWLDRVLWRLGEMLPERIGSFTLHLVGHFYTQRRQRRLVRELVKQRGVNVVHEPVPVAPKYPSAMHSVGAPVIVGPMNGGMDFPAVMQPKTRWLEQLGVGLARRSSGVMNRLLPGKRRAALLLVANQRTARALPVGVNSAVLEVVENGVDLTRWPLPAPPGAEGETRKTTFIFVGRLIEGKGVGLLVDALRIVADRTPCELHIVGDGPLRRRIEEHVRRVRLDKAVVFHGFVPQAKCARYVGAADILVFPTLFDCGGAVVLEAMAMKRPVIATNWGGPADYLDESCGVLIEPAPRKTFVANLAAAMIKLAEDRELSRKLGAAGRAKIERDFDWERKVDRMLEIYRDVVNGK